MSSLGRQIQLLLEMIRFSHTLFALPFALLAAVMAWKTSPLAGPPPQFRWTDGVGILLCMVCARSAAMAFNRLADRRLDAANPRTASRHLPAGLVSVRGVVLFTVVNAVGFLAATSLFLPNRLPLLLSVPVLAILLLYSLTKRVTWLAHFWLGLSLMLAPISVWIALRGEAILAQPSDLWPAVMLGTAVLLWVAGFDIIYACQDVEVDRKQRLQSVPARWGVDRALRLSALCHLAMVVVLVALPWTHLCGGPTVALGGVYYLGVLAVAALLLYEHSLVRPDDLTRVNLAFFHVNSIVSMGLFVVGTIDLLW